MNEFIGMETYSILVYNRLKIMLEINSVWHLLMYSDITTMKTVVLKYSTTAIDFIVIYT